MAPTQPRIVFPSIATRQPPASRVRNRRRVAARLSLPPYAALSTTSAASTSAAVSPRTTQFGDDRSRDLPFATLVADPVSSRSATLRCLVDLRRVLPGVLTHPPGEELDGHDTERGMATLAQPVGIGERLEQPCELLMLGHDGVQETSDRFAAGQAGAAIALLVEIGEDGRVFVEKAPDPEPVDVDDDIAQVGQSLQRRPLALPRRLAEPSWRRGLHGALHDAGRRPHPLEDRAMLRTHSRLPPVHSNPDIV